MSTTIFIKEAILVPPSTPTPNQTLKLSTLDSQPFLRFTFEYLLLYKPTPHLHTLSTTTQIKSALAQILVPYYPLAGTVRSALTGRPGLEVVCNNQGALFILATSDAKVCDFENVPKQNQQWRKLLCFHVTDVLKGAPPLVVQLTWLSDGGATLAVGFSHCLLDGIGSGEFLNSFAELARGGRKHGFEHLDPYPIWSRHLMSPSSLLQQLSKKSTKTGLPFSHKSNRIHAEFKKIPDTCGFLSRFSTEELVPTSITFDKQTLNKLKNSITPLQENSVTEELSYTSFEVLSAHIWRSWARSLNLPSKQVVKLLFSINVRNKVKPSLPRGYYGNAFVLGCVQARVNELTEKGLKHATELVKRAKSEVEDGYVREVVELVSLERASVDSVGVLILSDWSKLGLDEVDFGMGNPVQVGPVCCDKYCLLLPVDGQKDAVKVNLAVPAGSVDHYVRLLKSTDTDFW